MSRAPTPPAADRQREREPLTERRVAVADWRDTVAAALAEGWRFAALWTATTGDAMQLRAALTRDGASLVLVAQAADGRFASIVDLVAAAAWDEREAHDVHGAAFAGHEPLRPLVAHPDELADWTVAVEGRDPFQVAVGPIHAGVIESGHFRFAVVGERILHLDLRLFYAHRGLERAAEGHRPQQALGYAQRACAADAVANAIAFAQACEAALGRWPHPDLARARTLLAELERLYNHLNDISAICAGVGFAAGTMLFAALKERAQRLNERLCGHRFLFDQVQVARSELRLDATQAGRLRDELARLRADHERAWRELQFAGSVQERFDGVGVISAQQAAALGAVGPSARASGIAIDARCHSPRLAYAGFTPAVEADARGDVAARLALRAAELRFVFDHLHELLARPLAPAQAEPARPAARDGLALVESPRGQTLCAVALDDDGRVARLHLRTGSYANWPLVAEAARGELLPDFPLINKSFELCYACTDR